MSIAYIEWFTENTYRAVKALMRPHPDLPDTYQEWLYLKTKQIADIEASGSLAQKVEIDANEFSGYCRRMGCDHDTVALHNFTYFKGSGHENT